MITIVFQVNSIDRFFEFELSRSLELGNTPLNNIFNVPELREAEHSEVEAAADSNRVVGLVVPSSVAGSLADSNSDLSMVGPSFAALVCSIVLVMLMVDSIEQEAGSNYSVLIV
jgi:hypothetical protein